MNNIKELYSIIEQSDITLIGYTYKDEFIKNKFISKLNPFRLDISNVSNIHSYIRNIKIESVLSEHINYPNNRHLIVNIEDINITDSNSVSSRAKTMREICFSLKEYSHKYGYKTIITAPLNRNFENENVFMGGTSPFYYYY